MSNYVFVVVDPETLDVEVFFDRQSADLFLEDHPDWKASYGVTGTLPCHYEPHENEDGEIQNQFVN